MISFFSDLETVTYFNASLALQGRAVPAAQAVSQPQC